MCSSDLLRMGGRGMKVVQNKDEIQAAIDSSQREALAYFGRDEIYMERYLTKPRHVEVQVLCDQHGNAIYLGTRDCSAQRRHQKLIEEAPAFNIPESILKEMGEAAVAVAKGCDYVNAGTVEFLYENEEFFYLEMNTRLQVEHPVTEMVTGIDLVEQQLRVAFGEQLSIGQEEVEITGHAIEVRINAEDPAEGQFLPSPGRLTTFKASAGFGTRWDGGYEEGDEISQFYDNLVGKLICWGKDRQTAIARTIRALEEFEVSGLSTTIPADLAILRHSDFQANKHSTKWVEESLDLTGVKGSAVEATEDGSASVVRTTDVEVNGKRFSVSMSVPSGKSQIRRSASSTGASASGGDGKISVPMQGTIVKIQVAVGDTVQSGDILLVLEAMKMENNISSDVDGTISEIGVSEGDSVGAGDIVVVIDPDS